MTVNYSSGRKHLDFVARLAPFPNFAENRRAFSRDIFARTRLEKEETRRIEITNYIFDFAGNGKEL